MIHHIAFGAETLAAGLGALERPSIVVHAQVYRQIVPIVERFAAGDDWTDKICPKLVVGQVGLEVSNRAKFFLARLICTC